MDEAKVTADKAKEESEKNESELRKKIEQLKQEYADSNKLSDERIGKLQQQLAQAAQEQTTLQNKMQADSRSVDEQIDSFQKTITRQKDELEQT